MYMRGLCLRAGGGVVAPSRAPPDDSMGGAHEAQVPRAEGGGDRWSWGEARERQRGIPKGAQHAGARRFWLVRCETVAPYSRETVAAALNIEMCD